MSSSPSPPQMEADGRPAPAQPAHHVLNDLILPVLPLHFQQVVTEVEQVKAALLAQQNDDGAAGPVQTIAKTLPGVGRRAGVRGQGGGPVAAALAQPESRPTLGPSHLFWRIGVREAVRWIPLFRGLSPSNHKEVLILLIKSRHVCKKKKKREMSLQGRTSNQPLRFRQVRGGSPLALWGEEPCQAQAWQKD